MVGRVRLGLWWDDASFRFSGGVWEVYLRLFNDLVSSCQISSWSGVLLP